MKDRCGVEALKAIEEVSNLAKDGIIEIMVSASKDIKSKSIINKLGEDLNNDLDDFLTNFKKTLNNENFLSEEALEFVSNTVQKKVIDLAEQTRAVRNTIKTLDAMSKGSKKKSAIHGIIGNFFTKLDNASAMANNIFNALETAIWKGTMEGGTKKNADMVAKAKLLYFDELQGGTKLKRYLKEKGHENPDYEIAKALEDGHHADEVLNVIATNIKKLEADLSAKLKNEYPNFIPPRNNFKIDKAKVYADKEGFVNFLMENIEPHVFMRVTKEEFASMGEEGVKKFRQALKDQVDDLVDIDYDPYNLNRTPRMKNPFNQTDWEFKSFDSKYKFKEKYGDTAGGEIVSNRRFNKNQYAKASMESLTGKKAGLTFNAMRSFLYEKYKDQLDRGIDDIDLELTPFVEEFKNRYKPVNSQSAIRGAVLASTKFWISGSLLAKSFARNIFSDNSMHTGMVQNAYDGRSSMMVWAKQATALSASAGLSIIKSVGKAVLNPNAVFRGELPEVKLSAQQEFVADMLEGVGQTVKLVYSDALAGQIRNRADLHTAFMRGSERGKIAGMSFRTAQFASKLAESVSIFTGAEATNRAARIHAGIQASSLLDTFFKKQSWDALKPKDQALMMNAGFTKEMFDTLKNVKRNEYGLVDGKAFQELDVSKLTDEFTTTAQARKDIEMAYHNLFSEISMELAPLPQTRTNLVRGSDPNTLSGFVLDVVSKFTNINMSAYLGYQRATRRAMGLDANEVTAGYNLFSPITMQLQMLKNPVYAGKLLSQMTLGGMMIGWSQNIMNGEPLEAITPQSMVRGIARTEAFGLVSEILNNIFWGGGLIGDTTESIFQSGMNVGRTAYKAYEGKEKEMYQSALKAKRTLPIVNIWWLGMGIDKAVKDGMNVPTDKYTKRKIKRRGKLEDQVNDFF